MPSSAVAAVSAKGHRVHREKPDASLQDVSIALSGAQAFLWSQQRPDGMWCGAVEAAPTLTALYVVLLDMLAVAGDASAPGRLRAYLLRQQRRDGAWASGNGSANDVASTALVFLALRLLGVDPQAKALAAAEIFILQGGGLAQLDAPTRGLFALYGLTPWDDAPVVPLRRTLGQGALIPAWARNVWMPWAIIGFHRPLMALPNGRKRHNPWLDRLWLPHHARGLQTKSAPNRLGPGAWLRSVVLRETTAWVLQQQSPGGLWPGGALPTMVSLLALRLQGLDHQADAMRRGLQALRQLLWEQDESGPMHLQPTRAAVRDTAIGALALAGRPQTTEPRLQQALDALFDRQIPDPRVATRIARPQLETFELHPQRARWARRLQMAWRPLLQRHQRNVRGQTSWRTAAGWAAASQARVPEALATADVLLAALQCDPGSSVTVPVRRGVCWLLATQRRDGGWRDSGGTSGAWERLKGFASAPERATPLVTARACEALALWKRCVPLAASHADRTLAHLRGMARAANRRAVVFLREHQDAHGSWSTESMGQHLEPTAQSLRGLRAAGVARGDTMVASALRWLRDNQNADGGWGDTAPEKSRRRLPGEQKSAPVATAWALLGLLAYLPSHDSAIERGVIFLVQRQVGPTRARPRDADGALPSACGKTWRDDVTRVCDGAARLPTRPHLLHHVWPLHALACYVAKAGGANV